MESNIKELVAAGHEMASELKAECGAVDMRSVAKLLSDLATQLEVQLARANALAAENARYSMSAGQADQRMSESCAVREALGFNRSADDVSPSDLVDKIKSIIAECDAIRSAHPQPLGPVMDAAIDAFNAEEMPETGMLNAYFILRDSITVQTPSTDAFLAEVRARGVEMFAASLKVARIRADFDDFDGDRRGIGDCLDEAEQELIVTINKYASQLAAEPIATNDVREQQTAVPPIQADVAQAIENLKQKLVECNRYNYCADAVKGVEDACHAAMLQGSQPVSQTYNLPELIEGMEVSIDVSTCDADLGNRYFGTVTEALELDTAKNGYILLVQDAEPNFDVNGNSPVTPDGWISCSERMPNEEDVLVYCSDTKEQMVGFHKGKGLFQFFYMNGVEGVCEPSHWMPLPEPPQEVK
ncbi:DUF551 domain-containing protein [Escherichia coli]|uniref:DUF551 domain-containing protein n=3 Tax=Escherichia coli TaxID=562 RepID=UPI001CDAE37A|nr:DUF551 domain-containing protein [Escherichia coli]